MPASPIDAKSAKPLARGTAKNRIYLSILQVPNWPDSYPVFKATDQSKHSNRKRIEDQLLKELVWVSNLEPSLLTDLVEQVVHWKIRQAQDFLYVDERQVLTWLRQAHQHLFSTTPGVETTLRIIPSDAFRVVATKASPEDVELEGTAFEHLSFKRVLAECFKFSGLDSSEIIEALQRPVSASHDDHTRELLEAAIGTLELLTTTPKQQSSWTNGQKTRSRLLKEKRSTMTTRNPPRERDRFDVLVRGIYDILSKSAKVDQPAKVKEASPLMDVLFVVDPNGKRAMSHGNELQKVRESLENYKPL